MNNSDKFFNILIVPISILICCCISCKQDKLKKYNIIYEIGEVTEKGKGYKFYKENDTIMAANDTSAYISAHTKLSKSKKINGYHALRDTLSFILKDNKGNNIDKKRLEKTTHISK